MSYELGITPTTHCPLPTAIYKFIFNSFLIPETCQCSFIIAGNIDASLQLLIVHSQLLIDMLGFSLAAFQERIETVATVIIVIIRTATT
mgnify:CR=1 FL=1